VDYEPKKPFFDPFWTPKNGFMNLKSEKNKKTKKTAPKSPLSRDFF
jgi:hypothetical protein